MLATLAIINMAVAAVLITGEINEQAISQPEATVIAVEAQTSNPEHISWAEE